MNFQQGGAKGLLLSQLGVREGGNVVFDTSEYQIEKINFKKQENYSLAMITELINPDWESYSICDAFSKFSFQWNHHENNSKKSKNSAMIQEDISMEPIDHEPDDTYDDYETFNNFAENLQAKDDQLDFVNNNDDEDDLISKILGEAGTIVPGLFFNFLYKLF